MKADPSWNWAVAEEIARELGYPGLDESQKDWILLARSLFSELNRFPSQRVLVTAYSRLKGDGVDSLSFYKSFGRTPHPLKALARLSGLPEPSHCL